MIGRVRHQEGLPWRTTGRIARGLASPTMEYCTPFPNSGKLMLKRIAVPNAVGSSRDFLAFPYPTIPCDLDYCLYAFTEEGVKEEIGLALMVHLLGSV